MQLWRSSLGLILVVTDCYTLLGWWQYDWQWETWPPIDITLLWLVGLKIDWDCPVLHCIMGSHDQWEFQLFSDPSDSPFALQLPAVRQYITLVPLTDSMQSFSPRCLSPHSLIKQRQCQHTIIETVLLTRNYKIKQSNETLSQFCTLHNHGPTRW